MPYRIMFVCTGNICRSPMAHAVMQHKVSERNLDSVIEIESSGTTAFHIGEDIDPRAQKELRRNAITFDHSARDLTANDLQNYDLILTMDRSNYREVMRMAKGPVKEKVRMFRDFDPAGSGEVPDPYYGGKNGFRSVYEMIDRTTDAILDYAISEETA